MSLKRGALNALVYFAKFILKIAGKTGRKIASAMAEELVPVVTAKTKHGPIQFFCPGELPVWRAENLLTREPETIEWIDGFEEDSVLWDIGANIGIFSLYANLRHGISVLAFEPAAPNYYVLNKNIEINRVAGKV
jgi:hypothetical protein